jgi:hypothetical protein
VSKKLAGVPAWSYAAILALALAAWHAFHHQPTTTSSGAQTPDYIIVESPQQTTPFDVPVTRTNVPLSSTVPLATTPDLHNVYQGGIAQPG